MVSSFSHFFCGRDLILFLVIDACLVDSSPNAKMYESNIARPIEVAKSASATEIVVLFSNFGYESAS